MAASNVGRLLRRIGAPLLVILSLSGLLFWACVRQPTEPVGGVHQSAGTEALPTPASPSANVRTADPAPQGTDTEQQHPDDSPEDGIGVRFVSWITSFGPLGGAYDPEEAAWHMLLSGKCASLPPADLTEPSRTLYTGAKAACLAAFHDRPDLWAAAEAALADVRSDIGHLGCLQRAVHIVLTELVKVHREHPEAKLIRSTDGPGIVPRCPSVTEVQPDHGPSTGGYFVTIRGQNLPTLARIHFAGVVLEIVTNGHEGLLEVPPASGLEFDDSFAVWVDGDPWAIATDVFFTYDTVNPSASSSSGEQGADSYDASPDPGARASEDSSSGDASDLETLTNEEN